jgi:phasin family protein
MSDVEQFQQKVQEQANAAVASAKTVAESVQAITAAHAEYAKKALQDGSEFISKLSSIKAPGDFTALQTEFAKSAYETFVAESKKISNLYADLAKQAYKPLEGLVTKMTPPK